MCLTLQNVQILPIPAPGRMPEETVARGILPAERKAVDFHSSCIPITLSKETITWVVALDPTNCSQSTPRLLLALASAGVALHGRLLVARL